MKSLLFNDFRAATFHEDEYQAGDQSNSSYYGFGHFFMDCE
jgi:hypothetical protein